MARKSIRDRLIRQLVKLIIRLKEKGFDIPPIGCPPIGGEDTGLPIFCPVNLGTVGVTTKIPSLWASPVTFRFF